MKAFYNEIDRYCCDWLSNLMDANHITPGKIDDRSIADIRPNDVAGYDRVHFFAGIAGWELSLNLAGWGARKCWTGSCPCQPFSAAGKGIGFDDARHLWPTWFNLIRECRPGVVFGEQVASKDGLMWLDLVHSDMENAGYAFAALDMCSAGFGAPHIRQRLGFVADAVRGGAKYVSGESVGAQAALDGEDGRLPGQRLRPRVESPLRVVADADDARSQGRGGMPERADQCAIGALGVVGGLANAECRPAEPGRHDVGSAPRSPESGAQERERLRSESRSGGDPCRRPGPTNGFWGNPDWLLCRDGKWRPVEPGTFPLLDGLSASLGRLCALEVEAWEEILEHGRASNRDPHETLRMVRSFVHQEAGREGSSIGVCLELHETPLLLNFLLCVEAARDGAADRSGFEKASDELRERVVLGLRPPGTLGGSPHQRQPDGQPSGQFSDALLALSLVLARHAAAYRAEARKAHASSSRVGMLRAYGNAINPHQFAEFIRAYSEHAALEDLLA